MLRLNTVLASESVEWSPAADDVIVQTEAEESTAVVEIFGRQDALASWRHIVTITNTTGTLAHFYAPKFLRAVVTKNTASKRVRIWDGA